MTFHLESCMVAYCDSLVATNFGPGLVLCEPCRDAIWGDTDPHYDDEEED
jgi:hypothetical protein